MVALCMLWRLGISSRAWSLVRYDCGPICCDRISFVSNEQIDCGVIGTYLQPTHNRDMRYWITISSDPHSAYVLPPNHSAIPALEKKVAAAGGDRAYQRLFLDGYVWYIPRGAYHSP